MQQQEILDFAYDLATKASKMIVDGAKARWETVTAFEAKKNDVDLVTKTDQAVEEMIKSSIRKRFPHHKFIGEETYEAEKYLELTDDYTWIVDPIDGTMNFIHSFPMVACSIGVTFRKTPIVGVIALPFMDQIFSASCGTGAFLNRTILLPLTGGRPQPLAGLRDCLIGSEWGTDRSMDTMRHKLASFARLAGDGDKGVEGGVMAHALRTTGSSACSLAMVIAGQLDVYWDAGMWPWDVCAGICILRETGGYVSGGAEAFSRRADDAEVLMGRRIVAVRAVAKTEEESAREIQERIVTHLYEVVETWTNSDMVAPAA